MRDTTCVFGDDDEMNPRRFDVACVGLFRKVAD
jgi:hypothetical protein